MGQAGVPIGSGGRDSRPQPKKFYEKPSGIIVLGVIASLIASILYYFFVDLYSNKLKIQQSEVQSKSETSAIKNPNKTHP